MVNIIDLLEKKSGLAKVGQVIWEQILDLVNDFMEVFNVVKLHTYDALCNQFGSFIVNLFGICLIFGIIMFVAMAIINK